MKPNTLKLIQDVCTRWDSTFYMMARAFHLRNDLDLFLDNEDNKVLRLSTQDWTHIAYLIDVTRQFAKATNAVSRTKKVTAHQAFRIYNKLFEHLENVERRLRAKRVPWKGDMQRAIKAATNRLSFYYDKTRESLGYFYS